MRTHYKANTRAHEVQLRHLRVDLPLLYAACLAVHEGRTPHVESHPLPELRKSVKRPKLTRGDIIRIRSEMKQANPPTLAEMAASYAVSLSTVWRAIHPESSARKPRGASDVVDS